ncbi:hypothetical protein CRUP_018649 [Coryphaenoides rupestris]|nr:hypothetical protein CRUP_018649 [Coryphaenoides rupestris]
MVVKKLLFPQVQGSHIDQVLQEHKVELRPTTLSEEKHLTQLHKQAFSSKLRRLMSLKHLPDIYTDVLNLFHHACVSKRLGVNLDGAKHGESVKARKRRSEKDLFLSRGSARVSHRNQRREGFSWTLRSLSDSRRRRSLLKIRYCPYLSACHSAEHRRRWVLRSAVQRAQRAMKFHYPDLVGKKILHLYEEDDKSEVWYSGEVVCIHEAHPNPLKNVFEVQYDSEPEWKYYLELLMDYKKGWLKIDE